jgi:FkbM family methyltransferase
MHYTNIIKRFILRKDFFKRAKSRIDLLVRHNTKNEMDDLVDIYHHLGRKPNVIFDCGANIGFVTYQYTQKFKEATIYSFEPNPNVFKQLAKQYYGNNKVVCINAGIGSESGKMTFFVNKNSGTSSFLSPTEYHMNNMASHTVKSQVVEILSIDDVMKKNNIDHIDILKLDIEGFEIEAMKGIINLKEKVSFIYAEVNFIPTYEGQPLIEDVIAYCRNQGFHFLNFYGINETSYHQSLITNILFVSDIIKEELSTKLGKKAFGY